MSQARVSSGVPGLDELIEGGFPRYRSILVCGDTGTGKTILASQFLVAGLKQGEHGALVTVDEKPQHLLQDAERFGWDLGTAIEQGKFLLLDASPYFTAMRGRQSPDARQVASDLAKQTRGVKAQRLIIDSLTSLVPEMESHHLSDFLRLLIFSLEDNLGCTVLLTARTIGVDAPPVCRAAQQFASGIVELRFGPRARRGSSGRSEDPLALVRSLLISKMRGTAVDLIERPFDILDKQGLVLCHRTPHTLLSQKSAV